MFYLIRGPACDNIKIHEVTGVVIGTRYTDVLKLPQIGEQHQMQEKKMDHREA